MKFIADLHIHSRFSRATAKNLDFPHLYMAARQKGIAVVATGDFTHPGWLAEIRENLEPAEPGLLKLKDHLEKDCEKQISVAGGYPVRFMLCTEISNIYKKGGVTRKIHHLVFFPEISHVEKFNARLSAIGNLKADGRPILGLDSKKLLEIVLETHESGFLIPAHIWTPWFSLFGSKSGFDSVAECFGELSDHIFAIETGLSSDPPMNWRIRDLDNRTLVSNSDAHSPANLGREANLFDTDLSYAAMREAIETGDREKFLGTLEFFPEEGKYHQDGHRKCGINLHPRQTIEKGGICPVCGAPVTVGVLYRVEQLAGRREGEKPEKTHPFYSLIPLAEILSELMAVGPKSKKVVNAWQTAISHIGPELPLLHDMPVETIKASGNALLAEAIDRMRRGEVYRQPGYDGQYGRVTIFTKEERDRLTGQKALFTVPGDRKKKPEPPKTMKEAPPAHNSRQKGADAGQVLCSPENQILAGLNEAQLLAVTHSGGSLLISAGPGTGKTRTLTCRIAYLIEREIATPEQILAITFTNKAASQMKERLANMLGPENTPPAAQTFHSFCFSLLKEIENSPDQGIVDEEDRRALLLEAVSRAKDRGEKIDLRADILLDMVIDSKQRILSPEDDLSEIAGDRGPMLSAVYCAYQDLLETERLYDYEDLICRTVMHLEADPAGCKKVQKRYPFIFIDEYQDLNYAQYRLVRLLCPENGQICVIGDPDQSIYGFRGSDPAYFQRFMHDFPNARSIRLTRSYRSTQTILTAATQLLSRNETNQEEERIYSDISGTPYINILPAESEHAEAVAVGKMIEQMVGGMGFEFNDFGKKERAGQVRERSFADFAVLYRTRAQGDVIAETFAGAGIPHQRANKTDAWGLSGIAEPVSALKIIEGCGSYRDLERLISAMAPQISAREISALKSWGRKRRLPVNGLMAEALRMDTKGLSAEGKKHLHEMLEKIFSLGEKTADAEICKKLAAITKGLSPFLPTPGLTESKAFEEIKAIASSFGSNARGFMETLALYSDPDFFRPEAEKVSLLTMHAAKGLEFPVVFVTGCEDGLIPYSGSARQHIDTDEERRLFYVAMTRAMEELFLVSAKTRRIYGQPLHQQPSPFLADIPDPLKKTIAARSSGKKAKQVQLTLFQE
ncbi:MAG: UvrD-helicase domain-containing protein [Desulfobacteraceae bacterium]|nr:UvrD-helicase domain-containing protein [Desulfobacteraceae bacterium]